MSEYVEYKSTEMDETHCPSCSRHFNCVASPEGDLPSPKDFTLCAYCGAFLRFDDKLQPVLVTDAEILKEKEGYDLLLDMYAMRSYLLSDEFELPTLTKRKPYLVPEGDNILDILRFLSK